MLESGAAASHTVGSLQHRPDAGADAENLVLAADYVRTYTDLATMEAARRAVNEILERSGTDIDPCFVRDLSFPPLAEPLRNVDGWLYRRGRSHPGEGLSNFAQRFVQ